MSILKYALRVEPGQSFRDATTLCQTDFLKEYLSHSDDHNVGDILLVPTYRLEEVEEVIEPEKLGAPVEPYVGLSWTGISKDDFRVVVDVDEGGCTVAYYNKTGHHGFEHNPTGFSGWANYPRTPSTPAVTRKVKKWVKIADSSEC